MVLSSSLWYAVFCIGVLHAVVAVVVNCVSFGFLNFIQAILPKVCDV
jgi:hypothetical protein